VRCTVERVALVHTALICFQREWCVPSRKEIGKEKLYVLATVSMVSVFLAIQMFFSLLYR